ncbi:hypothetical protein BC829DRAFT_17068 [Chytridium lagenaria]|nr:hypothetical protein BC829DRAFT_17068 [Chytridium lagenaria]
MASLKLDAGLFPTYSYTGSTPMAETFQIRYIVRCSLKAANNPVPALEKEITINAPTVDGSYLDPLSVTDMSPSGAFLNLRSARAQWVDRDTVTVFSTLAAPKDRDVASVFFEIMQKFYIPDPMTKGASMVGVERIFATFSTSGCPRTQNLDTILKLQMPNLPPSMEVGPVSVDYSIRAVLLFSGSPPPPVEFVCTTPILVLPPVKLQIDPSFDETDPDPGAKRTTGTLPVVLLKAQVSMNPVQRFLVGGGSRLFLLLRRLCSHRNHRSSNSSRNRVRHHNSNRLLSLLLVEVGGRCRNRTLDNWRLSSLHLWQLLWLTPNPTNAVASKNSKPNSSVCK